MSKSWSSNSEASGGGELSAGPHPPNTEMTVGTSQHDVAGDKPYSVFTHREKALIVSIASFAALFR